MPPFGSYDLSCLGALLIIILSAGSCQWGLEVLYGLVVIRSVFGLLVFACQLQLLCLIPVTEMVPMIAARIPDDGCFFSLLLMN